MRIMIALAALPVATFWLAKPSVQTPVVAKVVASEGVSTHARDTTTFRARWRDVADLPPMTEIIQEPLLLVSHESAPMAAAGSPVRPPLSRKVSLRHRDVCARHGMRKVNYGKRWRCRR